MSAYIILFVLSLITVSIYFYFYYEINEFKMRYSFKNILLILLFAIIVWLNNIYLNTMLFLKNIVSIIILMIIYKIIIKKNYKMSLFSALLLYFFNIMFDLITYYLITYFKLSLIITNLNILLIISTIFNNLLTIIILKIPLTKKIIVNFKKNFEQIMNSNLIIVTIGLFFVINISCFQLSLLLQSSIYVVLLFIGIIGLFTLYNHLCEQNKEIENYNKYLTEMNNVYGKIIDIDKLEKHNVKNILLSIKNVGDDNVKSLIDSYLKENKKTNIVNNELFKLPNSLKGIFGDKLYNYKKIKVIVDNNLQTDPFKIMEAKDYAKLCEIIGICLDNSIEAMEKSNDYIYILINEKEENYIISIKNAYKGIINLSEIGDKNYSTKNRGSGYGLYSLKKNKIFDVKISIKNNNFVVDITIKKSKMRK